MICEICSKPCSTLQDCDASSEHKGFRKGCPDCFKTYQNTRHQTITCEQLAAMLWFNVAGYDKDYSLSECVERFHNQAQSTQEFWLKKASKALNESNNMFMNWLLSAKL